MEEHLDRYRMYGLVPYNISPIQQGIQYGHALQEYNNNFIDWTDLTESPEYAKLEREFGLWRNYDKTFIILNGGTSMTMEQHVETLKENGIHIGVFKEPDLNMMITGIVFLVPENVYKRDEWPDFKTWLIGERPQIHQIKRTSVEDLKVEYPTLYSEWVEMVGGPKVAFLKEFTSQFRLA
jgi:hypothetical protein